MENLGYYLLIVLSTLLFGLGFILNKFYARNERSSVKTSLEFALVSASVISVIMFFINGVKFEITLYSSLIGLLRAVNSLLFTYCSIKALKNSNLALFTMFAMLGGMLLPSFIGVLFFKEALTLAKIVSYLLIALALYISSLKSKAKAVSASAAGATAVKKTLLYPILVFVFNGLSGVIAKIHQVVEPEKRVSASGFMLLSSLFIVIISLSLILIFYRKQPIFSFVKPKTSLLFVFGYATCNGMGNLLLQIAINFVDASIQYPVVTGGTIVVTAIAGIFIGEKLTKPSVIAMLIAFLSTLMIVLL